MNLVSGYENVDHNDVCFFFYISASIWAWMEYIHRQRKWQWALLAGALCGCAILTKWLTGLILYFIWGIYLLSEYKLKLKEWKIQHLLISLGITLALVLPWQIFILTHYHDAAIHEYQFSSLHLFDEIENHGEPFYYYFKTIAYLFIGYSGGTVISAVNGTQIITYLILLTGMIFLVKKLRKQSYKITLIVTFLFIYLFFSIAKTKMPAYPFMIAMIAFMCLGMFVYNIDNLINRFIKSNMINIPIRIVVILFFALYMGNFNRIRMLHTDECEWRKDMVANKEVFEKMEKTLPQKTLVFNVKGSGVNAMNMQFIEATFYSKRDCYALLPSEKSILQLKKMGFTLAFFTQNPLPDYILNDSELILINDVIYNDL